MGMFNLLRVSTRCPRCGRACVVSAQFQLGLREMATYRLGDRLRWAFTPLRGPGQRRPREGDPSARPAKGEARGDAWAQCPHCARDFWLTVFVHDDVLARAQLDLSKKPLIDGDQLEGIDVTTPRWQVRSP